MSFAQWRGAAAADHSLSFLGQQVEALGAADLSFQGPAAGFNNGRHLVSGGGGSGGAYQDGGVGAGASGGDSQFLPAPNGPPASPSHSGVSDNFQSGAEVVGSAMSDRRYGELSPQQQQMADGANTDMYGGPASFDVQHQLLYKADPRGPCRQQAPQPMYEELMWAPIGAVSEMQARQLQQQSRNRAAQPMQQQRDPGLQFDNATAAAGETSASGAYMPMHAPQLARQYPHAHQLSHTSQMAHTSCMPPMLSQPPDLQLLQHYGSVPLHALANHHLHRHPNSGLSLQQQQQQPSQHGGQSLGGPMQNAFGSGVGIDGARGRRVSSTPVGLAATLNLGNAFTARTAGEAFAAAHTAQGAGLAGDAIPERTSVRLQPMRMPPPMHMQLPLLQPQPQPQQPLKMQPTWNNPTALQSAAHQQWRGQELSLPMLQQPQQFSQPLPQPRQQMQYISRLRSQSHQPLLPPQQQGPPPQPPQPPQPLPYGPSYGSHYHHNPNHRQQHQQHQLQPMQSGQSLGPRLSALCSGSLASVRQDQAPGGASGAGWPQSGNSEALHAQRSAGDDEDEGDPAAAGRGRPRARTSRLSSIVSGRQGRRGSGAGPSGRTRPAGKAAVSNRRGRKRGRGDDGADSGPGYDDGGGDANYHGGTGGGGGNAAGCGRGGNVIEPDDVYAVSDNESLWLLSADLHLAYEKEIPAAEAAAATAIANKDRAISAVLAAAAAGSVDTVTAVAAAAAIFNTKTLTARQAALFVAASKTFRRHVGRAGQYALGLAGFSEDEEAKVQAMIVGKEGGPPQPPPAEGLQNLTGITRLIAEDVVDIKLELIEQYSGHLRELIQETVRTKASRGIESSVGGEEGRGGGSGGGSGGSDAVTDEETVKAAAAAAQAASTEVEAAVGAAQVTAAVEAAPVALEAVEASAAVESSEVVVAAQETAAVAEAADATQPAAAVAAVRAVITIMEAAEAAKVRELLRHCCDTAHTLLLQLEDTFRELACVMWALAHLGCPFPSRDQKTELGHYRRDLVTDLPPTTVDNWFTNWRTRTWKPTGLEVIKSQGYEGRPVKPAKGARGRRKGTAD